MKRTGTARPDVERRARENIEAGYQRLLGFEVRSEPGGFDWWGKPPANLFLTAYGLMEFRDLAEVHPVDPALLGRITAWLLAHQREDGAWIPGEERVGWSTDMAKGRAFPLTAYVAWGLARAGIPSPKALAWLEANAPTTHDPYGIALGALAFLASDPASATGRTLVDRLVGEHATDEHGVLWVPESETAIGARGETAAVETTALAIQALLLDGRHAGLASRALDRLVAWRGADGRFGTTQSTILALKALLAAAGDARRGAVEVHLGEGDTGRSVRLEADASEPVRVDLPPRGAEALPVRQVGEGRTRVSVARTTWVPWDAPTDEHGRLALEVVWPEEVLSVGRSAEAVVTVRNGSPDQGAGVVTVEVGIPPGCDVEPETVRGAGAEAVERSETAIVLYLRTLAPGEARTFRIPFRPRYALDVRTAPSQAYEYYVPEEAVTVPPRRIRAR